MAIPVSIDEPPGLYDLGADGIFGVRRLAAALAAPNSSTSCQSFLPSISRPRARSRSVDYSPPVEIGDYSFPDT